MEKIRTYEQYSQMLAAFKRGKARCGTNMIMMRQELTALIEAGKLYCEQIEGTLWFFSDEDYFYSAHLYAPADTPVRMIRQDKDVLVELIGNEARYDGQMESKLLAAGFDKHARYLEHAAQLDEIIDDVARQNKAMHAFWQRRGLTYRTAVRADYPQIRALWLDMLGRDSYNVTVLTDAELEEMERYGRCSLLCDGQGRILAAAHYLRPQGAKYAYVYNVAGAFKGSGLGAAAYFDVLVHIYEEGCTKLTSWVREDNEDSNLMTRRAEKLSGKFFWQFVFRA